MKKTILFLLAFLFVLTSCVEELAPNLRGLQTPGTEDKGLVAVTMELTIPQMELTAGTKAMAHTPDIESIHVAVFGLSGYPQAYAKAEPVGPYASTNYDPATPDQNIYKFKVLLPIYEGEAHVHIIANGPESITFVEQDEDSIMSQMQTTGNVGGYWARVVLPEGILPEKDQNGIMTTDDNGNFKPSAETRAAFQDLELIRNFAEIKLVVDSDAGISEVSWALVNVPKSGSMAPIKKDGNQIEYVDDYKNFIYDTKTRKMVLAEMGEDSKPIRDNDGNIVTVHDTYDGYMVSDALNYGVTDDMTFPARAQIIDNTGGVVYAGTSLWCYERPDPKKTNPAFILMRATYQGETCYYRVDLNDEVLKDYFALYRNYMYQISIHHVGNKGESKPTEAALHNTGGNMSISAETKTLTDVSDGLSRLYVEFVEKTYTNTDEKKYQFWAYYVPDITDVDGDGNAIIDNTKLEVSVKTQGTALKAGTAPEKNNALSTDDLYVYDFTLNGQSQMADLSSVIEVKADNGKSEASGKHSVLYRDITVRVMKKMDMILSLDSNKIEEGKDKNTVLHIALNDTLQESMFPLQFFIEDSNRTLNPTGKDGDGNTITVPVKTGASLYDNSDPNSYYYIRTVQWSEYEPMRDAWVAAKNAGTSTDDIIDFTTQFKTIKENSATTIYVDNEYFNIQSVDLLNRRAFTVSTASTEVAYNTTSAEVTITADEDLDWIATVDNGAGLTKAAGQTTIEGTGPATITVNMDLNTDSTSKTYTVTVVPDGDESAAKRVTIVQRMQPYYSLNLDAGGTDNTYGYAWETTTTVNPDTNTYDSYQSTNYHKASTIATMSVTVCGYTEFSIYIRSNAESKYDYVVVRKLGKNYLETWATNTYNSNDTKDHTRNRQNSGTTIDNYRKVTFTTDDGLTDDDTPHTFYIQYGKDEATNSNDDRGYILINKSFDKK